MKGAAAWRAQPRAPRRSSMSAHSQCGVSDEQLRAWFGTLAAQVRALDPEEATVCGRKLHQFANALTEVEQFHQIESALQIRQFIAETRSALDKMLRLLNVREDVLGAAPRPADRSTACSRATRTATARRTGARATTRRPRPEASGRSRPRGTRPPLTSGGSSASEPR